MKHSGAPSIGDIVEVAHATPRKGLVVAAKGAEIGIRYFKPWAIRGTASDFIWWIHRSHVKVISGA